MISPNASHLHVDVREKLEEVTLKGLDFCCMPCPTATDAMATKASILQKRGVTAPFIFVEMAEFLPSWFVITEGKKGSAQKEESAVAVGVCCICEAVASAHHGF